MANYKRCGRDNEDPKTMTCSSQPIEYQDDIAFPRMSYADDERERCFVCHVMLGGIHHEGCYMERCRGLYPAGVLRNKVPPFQSGE
jgi:hypothetical protein